MINESKSFCTFESLASPLYRPTIKSKLNGYKQKRLSLTGSTRSLTSNTKSFKSFTKNLTLYPSRFTSNTSVFKHLNTCVNLNLSLYEQDESLLLPDIKRDIQGNTQSSSSTVISSSPMLETQVPRDEIQLAEITLFKNTKHHSPCFITILLIYLMTNFALLCFCLHYRIESEEELFEIMIDTLFRKNLGYFCKKMNKK